jgi:AAA domain/Bifunctional DNA primase/polymerase, N-terminal
MTPLESALAYIGRGWNPVAVTFQTKKPIGDGWQHRLIDNACTAAEHFNCGPQNIGIMLGPTSHGLTDVDLDSMMAIAVAPYLLPRTAAIFGRESKRASHWLFHTDLAETFDSAALRFQDPGGRVLLELRIGGGSKGAQTVFPGSVHESGEPIAWEPDGDGEPATVDGTDLLRHVKRTAAAALLASAWPADGSRHDAALSLGGVLARAGFTEQDAGLFVESVARTAGDEEWRDRRTAARDAVRAHQGGRAVYGLPTLKQTFGEPIARKIAEWLGYNGASESAAAASNASHHGSRASDTPISVCAKDIVMTAVDWLWPNRFALGKIGLIVGLPDEGKGQLLCDMAARTTCGGAWPCEGGKAPLGKVIILTAEDDLADTVVPRLAAAGADLNRMHFLKMMRSGDGSERMFSLVSDLAALRQMIAEIGDVVMVQIDPISAYLGVGKIDSFRTTDVRAVLGPLKELAAELKVAIVGILHFNKKTEIINALVRISDSLAFGAASRHAYGVVSDAESKRKLLVRAKNNLASDATDKTLAYRFGLRLVGTDAHSGKEIWAPHVIWESQYIDVTAAEAMQAAADNRAPAARDQARRFLEQILANGPMLQTEIAEAAKANCIAERTLRRAKHELDVVVEREGIRWTWRLPDKPKPRQAADT